MYLVTSERVVGLRAVRLVCLDVHQTVLGPLFKGVVSAHASVLSAYDT